MLTGRNRPGQSEVRVRRLKGIDLAIAYALAGAVGFTMFIYSDRAMWIGVGGAVLGALVPFLTGSLVRSFVLSPVLAAGISVVVLMVCQYWISPTSPDVGPVTGLLQTVIFGGPIAAALGLAGAASRRYLLPRVFKAAG